MDDAKQTKTSIRIYIYPDEADAIKRRAQAARLPLSEYGRRKMLDIPLILG